MSTDQVWAAHGLLARNVKLGVVHAPGMPGTLSRPSRVSDPDMHHGTCVTHVPWCLPGLLTIANSFDIGGGENVSGIPSACTTRNVTYLVRAPYDRPATEVIMGPAQVLLKSWSMFSEELCPWQASDGMSNQLILRNRSNLCDIIVSTVPFVSKF